jgi:DNA-binding IclR family transcriptional regulator
VNVANRGLIKSASRVLALFEHLRERREAVTVSDVARALDMPQSSASMLLRTIETLGYLRYDGETRKFRPTFRLALLGDWVHDTTFDGAGVTKAMIAISRACGETIILGQQNKSQVQYVQIIQANYPVRLHLRAGTSRPMTCAATGHALLSLKPDKDVRAVVRRNNADVEENWQRVNESRFMRQIEQIRTRGYAETRGDMTPGASVLAMTVPVAEGAAPLALGIGGPTERIDERRDELLALLDKHLRKKTQ